MDLSCIISSGDLELYVLGMLPEEEASKIEQLAILFPEIQTELDQISEAIGNVASESTITPSPGVKDNLMNELKSLKQEENSSVSSLTVVRDEEEDKKEPAQLVALPAVKSRFSWIVAASILGLVLSLGAIVYLASINTKKETQITALEKRTDSLQNNFAVQQQQLQAYAQTVEVMQSADYKKIELTNVPGKPEALAKIFWNTKTKEVYVADISLPATPSGKQYQLWAIVDGKPVDAGMVSNVKLHAQKMKTFDKADAFAITLENAGGSPTPTMEAMYVMAKTS